MLTKVMLSSVFHDNYNISTCICFILHDTSIHALIDCADDSCRVIICFVGLFTERKRCIGEEFYNVSHIKGLSHAPCAKHQLSSVTMYGQTNSLPPGPQALYTYGPHK